MAVPQPREQVSAWTVVKLHFPRNSNTQTLINDINLFRQSVGACKISLYGTSYGTAVGVAFVTVFPEYMDKVVLTCLSGRQKQLS